MNQLPTWKNNLIAFVLLTLLVVSYFFYEQQSIKESYQQHSRLHSKILAAVVELNIRNVFLTRDTIETILTGSLANSGRFVAYLNDIDPFSAGELAAFAREAGLAGIGILNLSQDQLVSGPPDWLSAQQVSRSANEGLQFLPDQQLYLYTLCNSASCIFVGLDTGKIEKMLDDLSVERLLSLLSNLAGIAYVRVVTAESSHLTASESSTFSSTSSGGLVSETILNFKDKDIVVGLYADRFFERMTELRRRVIVFLTLLFTTGVLSSWWLYRVQRQRLEDARDFERRMARQREAAALGRTTVTITHEMRNPLNAIGIGLQRLELEAADLSPEHRGLVTGMREAVNRSNGIISRLRQYVHSFELVYQEIYLVDLLSSLINLYAAQCETQGVDVQLRGENNCIVQGDKNLLGQVFENLFKNAMEAQPDGGYIDINVTRGEQECLVLLSNGGPLPDSEIEALFPEPFFTTKAKGTGLGLSISKKIVGAHGGRLELQTDREEQIFRVMVTLPRRSNHMKPLRT